MFRELRAGGALLGVLACLAAADGATPQPGQYVDSNGHVVQRPVPMWLVGPDGKVMHNPAAPPLPPGTEFPAPVSAAPAPPPAAAPPQPAAPPPPPATVADGDAITLDFVAADVRDVAKAVLGDFLGLNYAVGAGVTGTVTIQTSRPVARKDVLAILEQALELNNLALVKRAAVYTIVPLSDARRQSGGIARRADAGEAGFGVQIVPLKYVGAAQMQHLLEPLVPSQAIVYADAQRNLLMIQGSAAERSAMMDEIALFDVDWLEKKTFRLLTPKYTDVGPLTKELEQFLGGDGSTPNDLVRLVPIQRLNAILAISAQPRYLARVEQMMDRLDRPGQGYERRVFFYAVQNSRASDLADALNRSIYGDSYRSPASDNTGSGADDFSSPLSTSGMPITPPPAPATTLPAAAPVAPPAAGGEVPDHNANAIVTVDKVNNALLINGTPQQYAAIREVLRNMDVAPMQVQLEAVIAEVTLNDGLEYGVQYFYQPSDKHQIALTDSKTLNITPSLPGFSYMFTQGSNIRIILSALSQVTHVEVVSSPNVMVLNNGTALLQVGNQVPISTGQAVSVTAGDAPIVNSIAYHATGVILKVTPSVNKSGQVTLEVLQEVSSVAPEADQTTIGSPTFTERKVKSTISIQDNETVALGGMISNSRTRGSSGLPYLSNIPVLGGLFGTKQNNGTRTELMVLITPHVIENLDVARAVTEELRRKFPMITPQLLTAAP
ncbi:MAG: type II secretion system secretin GspD [Alphaproteobacteria bacterium]|nr:type II secretion system secretin GspD [Alphaproteobacteria bacterium]MBL7098338.1 type II secretion system secretin GspD [Alphaproteobacteria bacterium]